MKTNAYNFKNASNRNSRSLAIDRIEKRFARGDEKAHRFFDAANVIACIMESKANSELSVLLDTLNLALLDEKYVPLAKSALPYLNGIVRSAAEDVIAFLEDIPKNAEKPTSSVVTRSHKRVAAKARGRTVH